ncbi:MAG TPA: UDP-N-acetylmuramoyl-L-alanyl-D-glutamate--2,6-diaminopimelate ligase [Vicinamibacterales bacterium]|nr:UDP-N-acetylmuramoyl-L-alanyl-D-glutamate--2,6-diaminopimelate ligase [Vicinamibacterales bacterium]
MKLGDLIRAVARRAPGLGFTVPDGEVAARSVSSVTYDSRQVTPGSVFVALKGQVADGTTFVREAAAHGAVAIVGETAPPPGTSVPFIQVTDARGALAGLAAAFFEDPSEHILLVGITGTNGKTTTAFLLQAVFEAAGIACGRIGTVGHRVGARELEAARTTPEAPELQRMLRDMVSQGSGACAMEVSSHALALRRADFLHFSAGVFTNLTRDHLDFHRDMEDYYVAKRRLFELLPAGAVGVTNLDDPRGEAFAKAAPRAVTYAIDAPADVRPGPLSLSLDGLAFEVRTPRGSLRIASPLVGRPNAYNILAVVATAVGLDLPFSAIEAGIAGLTHVPGRFEIVSDARDDVRVVVDYAHTDDALRNLLETARALARGRLITVFGCGGDRDRTKRPLMGAVAARLSDLVIITSDNPRSEPPERIVEEIKRGIVVPPDRAPRGHAGPRSTPHLAVVDRRAAIEKAIQEAAAGDLVLIAGKGHEKYQVIGDRVLPFDDVEVARTALDRRRTGLRVS